MKVVMDTHVDFGEPFLNDLRSSFPGVTFLVAPTIEEQMREVVDADVFLGQPEREVFLAALKLRWLHCPGTGIDQFLTPELADSNVVLTNARGAHAEPMADHVFAMILSLTHHIRELLEDQRAHRWGRPKYTARMVELGGKVMGILALGDIGRAVACRAHGFGMEVYAVDIRPVPPTPEVQEVWPMERLDDLIRISDWFVVTAPLTPESRGLIDRRRIGLLKPSAYFIVASRGGIVDETALAEALHSGRIAGAGLDAIAEEPLDPDSPLWDMENVILTPHVSADSPEMYEGRAQIFKENMRRFLANEPFLHVCDKQAGF